MNNIFRFISRYVQVVLIAMFLWETIEVVQSKMSWENELEKTMSDRMNPGSDAGDMNQSRLDGHTEKPPVASEGKSRTGPQPKRAHREPTEGVVPGPEPLQGEIIEENGLHLLEDLLAGLLNGGRRPGTMMAELLRQVNKSVPKRLSDEDLLVLADAMDKFCTAVLRREVARVLNAARPRKDGARDLFARYEDDLDKAREKVVTLLRQQHGCSAVADAGQKDYAGETIEGEWRHINV